MRHRQTEGGGGLVNAAEAASTNPQPEGNVIARGEDGVPWELYENGYLLFKPVTGKDTLTNNRGETSWKVNHGSKIKYIGFSGKVYAPTNSSYLFARRNRWNVDYNFNPITFDTTHLDTSKVTDMNSMFRGLSNLTNLDVTHFDTSKVTNMGVMFRDISKLTNLDVTHFNTSNVTNMANMFFGMSELTNLDVTKFDTSKVTDMKYMFQGLSNLTNLDVTKFDTSKVTDMSYMFYRMSDLTNLDVTNFDTSKVTDMSWMFGSTSKLTNLDVTHFDTSKVTDMHHMFYGMSNLTNLDVTHFDTSKVTNMNAMFFGLSNLTNLDVTHFDTTNVTTMRAMFAGMSKLTSLNVTNFNTSNVTDMAYMFSDTANLTNLNVTKFNTANVITMATMFSNMSTLTSLNVTNFDTRKVTNMSNMFYGMRNLTNLDVTHFDTSKVTDMREIFNSMPKLKELKLGDKFKADGISTISTRHNYGEQYTDKWHKVNDQAHPYTISDWANLYQSNPTGTAGTWVREEKVQDATLTFQGETFTPVKVKPSDTTLPTLPRPSWPKQNHKFLGWSKDGRNPITLDAVKPGETITLQPLWQPVNNTQTRTEAIPVTTTYRGDDNLDAGKRNETSGTPGEKRITTTYTSAPYTGELTNPVESTEIIRNMTPKVITIGTKPTVAKSNPVERTTRVNKDHTKPLGYKHVDTEGSDGYTEMITHYDVDSTNGNVTERTETRIVPPVERVVTEGALAYDLPTTGTADMTITLAGLSGALVITKRKKSKS